MNSSVIFRRLWFPFPAAILARRVSNIPFLTCLRFGLLIRQLFASRFASNWLVWSRFAKGSVSMLATVEVRPFIDGALGGKSFSNVLQADTLLF